MIRLASLTVALALVSNTASGRTVFLNFDAAWASNLDAALSAASAAAVSSAERGQIESSIVGHFQDAFSDFDLNFSTLRPPALVDEVRFGSTTASDTLLGSALLDFGNAFFGVAHVYAMNFDFIVESTDPRATQLQELATAIAGTAVHELLHGYGVRHNSAYGVPGITPSNYHDTDGLQNLSFMATGATGITELQREQPRTISAWSKVLLEFAQGIVDSPLPLQNELGDAGSSPSSAQEPVVTRLPVSQTDAIAIAGELSASDDIDWFAVDITQPGALTAELWSKDLITANDFEGRLRLLGPNGMTELASAAGIRFDGNAFGTGTLRSRDAYLLNIPIDAAGRYYIEVANVSDESGDYRLLVSATVPEPSPAGWLAGAVAVLPVLRRQTSSQVCV